jgi:hypothetical protein
MRTSHFQAASILTRLSDDFTRFLIFSFLVLVLGLGTARAQISGSLAGTVEDASSAAAPGAQILVLNQETGSKYSAMTNEKGGFYIGDLESGLYTVTATKQGFRVSTVKDVKVDTAKETSMPPIRLEVGAVTESVTVEAGAASLVNTSSADVSNTIYTQDINGLPLQDRNPLSMVAMQPGVSSAYNGGSSTVNGLRPTDSNMTLDGINIQDFVRTNDLNVALNLPFLGQVGEIGVTTSNSDVSMGGGASQVTMRTPSGSNTWHGEGFWENRINNLAANQFFNNADGVAKPRLLLNQFGGNLGGHIIKNKLFFYFFNEEYRLIQQTTNTDTILTPSARSGNFIYHEANGSLGTINVLTVAGYTADPSMTAILAKLPAAGNTTVLGDGNNTTGFLLNRSNNNNNNNVGGRIDYNLDAKNVINGSYSYNNNVLLRPDVDTSFSAIPAAMQVVGTNFMSVGWRYTPTASLTNEVRFGFSRGLVAFKDSNNGTISPGQFFVTLPNTYFTNPVDTFEPQGRNENSYAFLDNAIWNHGSHTIRFGVQSNLFHVFSYNSAGIVPTYTLGISTAQTKALSTSEFPGGVNSTDFANANNLLATLAGITSTAAQTFNVTTPTSGYVNGATNGRHYPYDSLAAYVGDQWRIRRNLTVNYGVRWEYEGRFDESNGLVLGPQITNNNPISTLLSNASVNFIGGSAKQPTYNRDLHSFAPNLGIAWDPWGDGKTSIRAGYSINYVNDNAILAGNNAAANNPGLSSSVSLANLTATLANKAAVGVPTFNEPQTFSQELANFGPTTATELINPNLATPYVQQWNLTIQHEFKGHTFASASYVGNHATKLSRVVDLNQTLLPPAYLTDFNNARSNGFLSQAAGLGFNPAFNSAVAGSVPLPYFATLASGGLLTNATVKSNIQLGEAANLASVYVQSGLDNSNFLPNPNIFVADYLTNDADSHYEALQLEVKRPVGSSLFFDSSYVWSKAITNSTPLNSQTNVDPLLDNANPGLATTLSPYNLPWSWKGYMRYNLPAGGAHAFHFNNRVANGIISGWNIAPIMSFQAGAPYSILSTRGTLNRNGRSANETADSSLTAGQIKSLLGVFYKGSTVYGINPSVINPTNGEGVAADALPFVPFSGEVFTNPGAGQVGILSPFFFQGPKFFDLDFAVTKDTRIHERLVLQFRASFFNLFNTVNFSNPSAANSNINSTTFGQISTTVTPVNLNQAARVIQTTLSIKF